MNLTDIYPGERSQTWKPQEDGFAMRGKAGVPMTLQGHRN